MRRLLPVLLLLLVAGPVFAQGAYHLRWNDCAARGGAGNYDFDCTTNEGGVPFVASFTLTDPVATFVGLQTYLVIRTALPCDGPGPCEGPELPNWWQIGTGTCRDMPMNLSLYFAPTAECKSAWTGTNPLGDWNYTYPYNPASPYETGHDRARIAVVAASNPNLLPSLEAGREYYAFRFDLDFAHSTGADGCAGCCTPVYIMADYMALHTDATSVVALPPDYPYYLTWQGGGAPCGPTPVARRSWGQIKSLYR